MHAIFLIFWETQINRGIQLEVMFLPTKGLIRGTLQSCKLALSFQQQKAKLCNSNNKCQMLEGIVVLAIF
jgi:hypothetical protein